MVYSGNWVNVFVNRFQDELINELIGQKEKFHFSSVLINQFHKSARKLLNLVNNDAPVGKIREADKQLKTKRNEICVAYEILNQEHRINIKRLEYEPSKKPDKKIDFRAITDTDESIWIEVKTIHPDELNKDMKEKKWNDFIKNKEYFSPRTDLIINFESGGAEIWHDLFSSRSHMLEYAVDFEDRISKSKISDNDQCVLAIIGNGYRWREDHLEDFVSFYKGYPRPDDTFARMQAYHIKEKDIRLTRRIDRFAYFEHRESSMFFDVIHWNVKPPNW